MFFPHRQALASFQQSVFSGKTGELKLKFSQTPSSFTSFQMLMRMRCLQSLSSRRLRCQESSRKSKKQFQRQTPRGERQQSPHSRHWLLFVVPHPTSWQSLPKLSDVGYEPILTDAALATNDLEAQKADLYELRKMSKFRNSELQILCCYTHNRADQRR
jgi:hypothetical protein